LTLSFEFDEHYQRPGWPSVVGRQSASQNLDIGVDDLEAAAAWATGQGATLADHQPQERFRVTIDPDVHPFRLS